MSALATLPGVCQGSQHVRLRTGRRLLLPDGPQPPVPSPASFASGCKLRQVTCGSQARRFRHEYQPEQTPLLTNQQGIGYVLDGTQLPDPPGTPRKSQDTPDTIRLSLPTAPFTRLQPAGISTPTSRWPIPLASEEYYVIEQQREYSRQWPRFTKTLDKRWTFQPGFLQLLVDSFAPPWFSTTGIQKFSYTWQDRVLQAAVVAGYTAAAVAVYQSIWAANYNVALVLLLHVARNKLSFGRLAMVLGLAYAGRLWVYWLFFLGARIDEVLARIGQPVRQVCWILFSLYLAFLAFSPLWMYPIPLAPIAPATSPMSHLNLRGVPF